MGNITTTPGLFKGYGIELEYMIVNKDSLDVLPIADEILRTAEQYVNELEFGSFGWSNEFVLHVIELKTIGAMATLEDLVPVFQDHITRINDLLASKGGCLMPTGMHPWMDPHRETRLWPHSDHEIYDTYDRVFNCNGHGWANLQSAHINLGFYGDNEFKRLHTAIRLLLPILPALAASSPIVEGKNSGMLDTRLNYYRRNQHRIPSIAGAVIPEAVTSRQQYEKQILQKIYQDISPYDPKKILQFEWLNSRGAIARFDRSAVEIRLLDVQECPCADIAIASVIIRVLKALATEELSTIQEQLLPREDAMASVLTATIQDGEQAVITDQEYLAGFGFPQRKATAAELWEYLIEQAMPDFHQKNPALGNAVKIILQHGPLARRILQTVGPDFSQQKISDCYRELSGCLAEGKMFLA